jgi:IS4 transposase
MDDPVFERFADESPMAVIAAILLARVFSPEKLDELFEQVRTKQYTQDLLFSTVFDLMNKVVCAIEPSVHSAYQSEEIDVSPTAVYDKLSALEPGVSAELVRYSGAQLAPVVGALESRGQDQESQRWLEGYRTKVLDGSCIDATERRIGELRKEAAAPLPGKALAVLDPEVGLITDFFPCEDGHAQERRLLGRVLSRVEPEELWIGDRNFATREFLSGIAEREAFFLIREHGNLPWEAAGLEESKGRAENGQLYEQPIVVEAPRGEEATEEGSPETQRLRLRRVRLVLDEPTRNGETEIVVLTDVPVSDASAEKVASLYRKRWTIERAFQELSDHLEAEVETLGYPKAALFGFAVGFVSYNVLSVLKSALASVYGRESIEEEVSGYYIAGEISKTHEGLMIALPPERWSEAAAMPLSETVELLRRIAENANLDRYQKHPRGPKKPPPKRTKSKHKPHVSTTKLLAQRKEVS